MGDQRLDWKPDIVKLESELIINDVIETDATHTVLHPESSHQVSSETSVERSPIISERFEQNSANDWSSLPKFSSNTSETVMVKIKEESFEDATFSSVSYQESRQDVNNEAFSEPSLAFPEKTELNFSNNLSSIPEPASSTKEFLAVYIKQEPIEDEVPFLEASLDTRQCTSSVDKKSVFPEQKLDIKLEKDLAKDNDGSDMDPLQIDSTEAGKKIKVKDICCKNTNFPSSLEGNECGFLQEPSSGTDMAENIRCKAENVDLLTDESASLRSENSSSSILRTALSSSCSDFTSRDAGSSQEKQFSCDQCPAKFTRRFHLKTHLKAHSDERPFSCNQCSARYKHRVGLRRHLSSHARERLLASRQHSPSISAPTENSTHIEQSIKFACSPSTSLISSDGAIQCSNKNDATNCTEFPLKEETSFLTQGPGISMLTSDGTSLNPVSFTEKRSSFNQCSLELAKNRSIKNDSPTHSNDHSVQFTQKDALDGHFNENLFSCTQCSAQFIRKDYLKQHYLSHANERPFACDQCPAKFNRREHLSRHLSSHNNVKAFSCPQCSAQFKRKDVFQKHLLTHSNEKPFSCSQCSVRFKQKCHLTQHLSSHAKEKAFSCSQCTARFKSKGSLQKHVIIHTGVKRFSCDQCSVRFIQKGHLNQHLLTHANEKAFSCSRCPARFSQKGNLNEHLLIHSNGKPFSCDFCSAQYQRKDNLKKHLLTHANREVSSFNECSETSGLIT